MKMGIGSVAVSLAAAMIVLAPGNVRADPVETVIHNFENSPDGSLPNASILVRQGVIYGVSPYGAKAQGFTGSGLVFRLSPPAAGQKQWGETFIHSFGAVAGGVTPVGQLIADSQGALYGVTMSGGTAKCSCGTVFKLTPPASGGGAWTRQVLHSFQDGSDGANPESALAFGAGGALYGTTTYGGGSNDGVVFKLTPPAAGKTQWTKTTLYEFTDGPIGSTDSRPRGRLLIRGGNIYGTTTGGTVFKLAPPVKGKPNWTETILFGFRNGTDGGDSEGGVVMDANGALYGTTEEGGLENCPANGFKIGCGVVYKLTPPAKEGARWKETVLHRFATGADGANPLGELLMDAKGALYGTTSNGGNKGCVISGATYGCGTIFKLSPPTSGASWTETVLYRFPETTTAGHLYYPQGIEPLDGLAADALGNLYGTANIGGTGGDGVVFKLSGSGFAVR